ncbi:MAG: TolC family protein [Bacteroidales bacterium]|nr:TolC family protein [Bacteroidales bacterium]
MTHKFKSHKLYLTLFTVLFASINVDFSMAKENTQDTITMRDVIALPLTPSVHDWTFAECVDWASANNVDIRRNLLDILQAEQDALSADDAWLPTVGFSTSHNYANYPFHDSSRNGNTYSSSYGVNAAWTAWEGNVRKYRQANARRVLQRSHIEGEELERALKLSILQGYMNILYAREAVEIARQTLEVSESQAHRAQRLTESGRSSRVDYAQIESQKAQDAYNLVQAQNNLESSRLALRNILQLGLGYDFDISSVNFPDSDVLAAVPSKEDTYSLAMAWLPSFKSNEITREILADEVKIAKAGYLPTISVNGGLGTGYTTGGANWASQMGHSFGPNIGLSLSVPIFDGNATKRAVAKAKLSELEYDLNKRTLIDDLTQTIDGLYIDASNAQAGYKAGLSRLEAASLTNELTTRQFELGLVNPLELLTAHNNYINARLEVLQCKYTAILALKTIQFYCDGTITMP